MTMSPTSMTVTATARISDPKGSPTLCATTSACCTAARIAPTSTIATTVSSTQLAGRIEASTRTARASTGSTVGQCSRLRIEVFTPETLGANTPGQRGRVATRVGQGLRRRHLPPAVPHGDTAPLSTASVGRGRRPLLPALATGGTMSSADEVLAGLGRTRPWQEDFYRDLHAHPELSGHESQTAAAVTARLTDFGYDVQSIGGGVVGVLANGSGATVLARADMDALPVTELTELAYASTQTVADDSGTTVGVSHACGHDVHVTCLLGAAELLAGRTDAWTGTFVALFQPAEETASGASGMLADGLAENLPTPDVALAQHVLGLEAGTVGTQDGPVMSAGDSIRITLFGKGSHGSMPHLSVDPVVLAASVVLRLQTIVARETKPGEFAVVTVGSSVAGTKSNIIPDRAVLLLNVRAYDNDVRRHVLEAIERIVRA